jgi:hypothetical protein
MAGTWCRWEKARFPDSEFTVIGTVRVHRDVEPLHTTSGRLFHRESLDRTGVVEEGRLSRMPADRPDDR